AGDRSESGNEALIAKLSLDGGDLGRVLFAIGIGAAELLEFLGALVERHACCFRHSRAVAGADASNDSARDTSSHAAPITGTGAGSASAVRGFRRGAQLRVLIDLCHRLRLD